MKIAFNLRSVPMNTNKNLEVLLNDLSNKYDVDLFNLPLASVKEVLNDKDWNALHQVIKYGNSKQNNE